MLSFSKFLQFARPAITLKTSAICFKTNVLQKIVRQIMMTNSLLEEISIKMPALSPTMQSGTIVKWHKKEGEKINAGDILCEVQTDKAIVAYEYDEDGVLAKILIDDNAQEINVGDLIAIICGEEDDWRNVKAVDRASSKPTASANETSKTVKKIDFYQTNKISPSARNLLLHYGIKQSSIKPSGPHGALLKSDVLDFISKNNLKPSASQRKTQEVSEESSSETIKKPSAQPSTPYIDFEITNMRRTIAKRLTESKFNTPHAYMSTRCFMDSILELRKQLKTEGITVSLNDMIIKATAISLRQVPLMNCQWNSSNNSVQIMPSVDISMAVATPAGLITPIIHNANRLLLNEISFLSKELINRAKEGKLKPEEFMGGTFSISNLGMFDIDHFTAVINPPQAGILAVGSTKKKFFGSPESYELRNQVTMTLSYDSRAIDEEVAADFLEKLQTNLENASNLISSDGSDNRRRLTSFL